MYTFFARFIAVFVLVSIASGYLVVPSLAATLPKTLALVAPKNGATLSADTLALRWTWVGASSYDVAVGSQTGMPTYGWKQGLKNNYTVFKGMPTDGSKIFIRIFAHFPNTTKILDATVTASGGVAPLSIAPAPVPQDPVVLPEGFLSLSPAPNTTFNGDTATFQWTHEKNNQMSIAVGSSLGLPNYAWVESAVNSATIGGLPTDGSKVYVRFFPVGNPSVDVIYTAGTQSSPTPVGSGQAAPVQPAPAPTPIEDPAPAPAPTPAPTPIASGSLTAVWANTGEDKITQEELRATSGKNVVNSVWNGKNVSLVGAKNEVVSMNVVLESGNVDTKNISVSFDMLNGPNGAVIASAPATKEKLFDWTNRNIELFFVRYLEIKGLSRLSYEVYDERHIPERLRRAYDENGIGSGTWVDRANHNAYYPEIAVPLELHPTFSVAKGKNQSIWADIYIPKNVPAGVFSGTVTVRENGAIISEIPVSLTVYNFTLADDPASDTMLFMSRENIQSRYLGTTQNAAAATAIRDAHFKMAHRYKISLIDADPAFNQPTAEWLPRLNGSLFTSANGYAGPGVGIGNGVYSIGTYGTWDWKNQGEAGMWNHTNAWETWFQTNQPATERFLYLIDEPVNLNEINTWTTWMENNPGIGKKLMSFATVFLPTSASGASKLDIHASWATIGASTVWQTALNTILAQADKRAYLYNAKRPAVGSFATEDDGVALRQLAWAQYKKKISRWFFWESTYYNNYQGGTGQTNVFQSAQTFGGKSGMDSVLGETGWNYSNGDGVLFYPGTDTMYPADSYNIAGPIASLRLKYWRRGIQDVDYLTLAAVKDPTKTSAIVEKMIPKVLWEYGVTDPNDPTWVRTDISWSNNPDVWENARKELAGIILSP